MADVRGFLADHRLGVTIVTAGLVVLGGVAMANTPTVGGATVSAIVDGSTIEVHVDGVEQRVSLLSVDTPGPGECLHEEATAFLEKRIPPGTEVYLELDDERTDSEGNLLAGVVEGGQLVNADIARNGLGVAVLVEPNGRFFDNVLAARDAGAAEGLGLFSERIGCTLPAQVREYVTAVEDLEALAGPGTLEEIDGWLAESAAVVALGTALTEVLDGDNAEFPLLAYTGPRWSLQGEIDAAGDRLAEVEKTLAAERRAETQRLEEAERRVRVENEH